MFETQKVVWGSCDATVLGFDASKFFEPIKGRLQCTDIQVPLDWAKPERGVAVMSMIRVSASVPAKRQGALFFNPGGPGATVWSSRRCTAWSGMMQTRKRRSVRTSSGCRRNTT
ncbi:hypothetical protein ACFP9V_22420 [Deinococcus radiopugnans]|uniref:hypothetical protein n=1 Tax=Deinococcus radiopugnans TaxID=57497 RepID=UPI00360D4FA1